ncbi:hypothetical protein Bhyg_09452 [Pseudolycoriella hygida]|uniref:2'-5'-oligoadenylate synthetase 1 domain-containing protein n=1 Tax=Pseudolycoriella hygida TaxID=35572 RepID=A0A9Q0N6I0_9DIPT|nr:hypothetical protein Bhyg_09452 [Pseudolycoriella hygida]
MEYLIDFWMTKTANIHCLSDEYIERGTQCISKMVEMLQLKSCYQINRHFIGGSVGKNTTTPYSDFDCYLFIDDIEYPYRNVLKNIGNLLRQNQPIDGHIKVDICIETPTVLTCIVREAQEEFHVDIAVAKNYATYDVLKMCREYDPIAVQQRKTLDDIKHWPHKHVYKMKAGLSSAIVRFVKQQNDFTRSMIRITKYWYNRLGLREPNSGMLLEILAIRCGQKENRYPNKSLLRCFERMLEMIMNFDELDVVFRSEYKFPEHQFDENTKLPRVMDPVNPYCNFAEFFQSNTKLLLKTYASESITAIKSTETLDFPDTIFKSRPSQPLFPKWFLERVLQSTWWVETTTEVFPMGVQVAMPENFASQSDDYYCVLLFLHSALNEIIDEIETTELNKLLEATRSFIQRMILVRKLSTVSSDRDYFHARMSFPIPNSGSILIYIRF